MLVSYNWLQDFLKLDQDPHELAEKITRSGVEIASVNHPQEGLKKIVIGHIIECEQVEGTHLHKCQVDVGQEDSIQIVCGAPNVAKNEDVIVALHGARIAGNEKIKRGKLRGISSEGMICSLQEIGFADEVVPEKYSDGIFVFPEDSDIKPGEEVYHALGMDDYILDFDITPNRADTLSMEGAAYEVGAISDKNVDIEDVVLKADKQTWIDSFKVIADEKLAPKYYLRKVSDIHVAESPLWIQRRLWNAGIKPVNNVIDIANYVMLLTGQPLNIFDADTLTNQNIEVRKAKSQEKIILANDHEIELDSNDIIVANGAKPIELAGILGSKNTSVTEDTRNIIIESAIFNSTLVRKAAFRHANRTESSSRFEKGVNWDNTEKAIDMAALLLRNDANGKVNEGIIKVTDKQRINPVVDIKVSYLNKILGTELSIEQCVNILTRLAFDVKSSGEELHVIIPNRRWDISIPADLVEEVGRIYGYDNIKSTSPALPETLGGFSPRDTLIRRIKEVVENQGLNEAISYSLTSPEKAISFVKDEKSLVEIQMPLNANRSVMRENIITGLVDAASYNMARKQKELMLFEQGRVYDNENNEFHEHEHLAALYAGHTFKENWQHENQKIDFYFVKGQLTNLFEAIGIKNSDLEYKAELIKGMHPTRTAAIYLKGEFIGITGMILPAITLLEKPLRGQELYVYELDLDRIFNYINKGMVAQSAPKFPAITRDLSLLVDEEVNNAQILVQINNNGGKFLKNVEVIDVYEGSQIEKGKKSISYTLTFLNEEATLTDEIIAKAMDKIILSLKENLKVIVR